MTDTNRLLEKHAPRTWQRMLSGRRLNLLDPSPMDVEIEDIALGLGAQHPVERSDHWGARLVRRPAFRFGRGYLARIFSSSAALGADGWEVA